MSQSVAAESSILVDLPEDITFPPSDLLSDEPPLETDLHRKQMETLIGSIESWWQKRQDFYVSGNLTIYYSPNQKRSEDFRGPDFFVVLGAERRDRKSWIVWHENGRYPNIIVELLSDTTAAVDKGIKKQIYQNTFRTPDYFWFDPVTLELKGFHIVDGKYQDLTPTNQNWLWSQQLELYLGIYENRLRFFTPDGQLVLLAGEQERQRAERAEQENRRLREQLQALGVEPEIL